MIIIVQSGVELTSPQLSTERVQTERTPEEKSLVWKQDLRIVPLCAGIYLLCYLDRSNIGNAKTLNSSTHDDLLSTTNMTNLQYT